MKQARVCILFFLTCQSLHAQLPDMVLPIGHTDRVYEAHFSRDGKKVITVSKDKTAKIWDVASGYLLADLKGQSDPVMSARFSPDGRTILTCTSNEEEFSGRLKIWDATTGSLRATIGSPIGYMNLYEFSSDSKRIFTVSDSLFCRNANDGNLLFGVPLKGNNATGLFISPDGKWVLYGSDDKKIHVCDTKNGQERFSYADFANQNFIIRFSADGKKMHSATYNETIIWDTQNWKPLSIVKSRIKGNGLFTFSADGNYILTVNQDDTEQAVYLWDALSRKLVLRRPGKQLPDEVGHPDIGGQPGGGLNWTNAAASGNRIAAVVNTAYHTRSQIGLTNDKTVLLWNIRANPDTDTLSGHSNAVLFMEFSPDGKKLVTTSIDGTAKIWDAASGQLLADLSGHTFNASTLAFSPPAAGGSLLVTTSDDGALNVWDPATLKIRQVFKGLPEKIFSLSFCGQGQKLVTASKEGNMTVWDAGTGRPTRFEHISDVRLDPTSEIDLEELTLVVPPVLSPDGNQVLSVIRGETAKMYETTNGKLLWNLNNPKLAGIAFMDYSPDGTKILCGWNYYDHYMDTSIRNCIVADAQTGAVLYKLIAESALFSPDGKTILGSKGVLNSFVLNAADGHQLFSLAEGKNETRAEMIPVYSPDGKKILATDWHNNHAGVWDAVDGRFQYLLRGEYESNRTGFSPDSKKAFVLTRDGHAGIWNAESGDLIAWLDGHKDVIQSLQFSPDSKEIFTTSKDFTMKRWDAGSGKCIATFFAVDSSGYFAQLPSGYYQTNPQASKALHYVTKELVPVSFEQLDVKYNRPDLVLQALGRTDSTMISMYRNAYLKRLKKLGFPESAFSADISVPEADILNKDSIPADPHGDHILLHIQGTDLHKMLDRFNVWVNEVPVFGQRGADLKTQHTRQLDTTITIQLTPGRNRIETSVTNSAGEESYRKPFVLQFQPAQTMNEKVWFIGIGTDHFADNSHNLQYCSKDIRDLSARLNKKYAGRIRIDTLFNEAVTIAQVRSLKQALMKSSVNDKVILAFSGHGLLSKELDYYLSSYSVNFSKPDENGLPYELLEELLDSIPARKKLMLIDACHSGELDKASVVITGNSNGGKDTVMAGSKGGEVKNLRAGSQVGLKSSFELMQELFVNVGRSTGATVISAAAGTELAQEKNELRNGVFTYSLMEIMDKYPSIRISELRKQVGERVLELTKGRQRPTTRNEPVEADWEL